jgi:hypothetical protein
MAVFASGAKSNEEKPRYDLIPHVALEREAIRMAEGAKDHGENNYRTGVSDPGFIRDRINHLIEHALRYADGDRSDDHLAAIRCNAGMLAWIEAQALQPPVHFTDAEIDTAFATGDNDGIRFKQVGQGAWVKA